MQSLVSNNSRSSLLIRANSLIMTSHSQVSYPSLKFIAWTSPSQVRIGNVGQYQLNCMPGWPLRLPSRETLGGRQPVGVYLSPSIRSPEVALSNWNVFILNIQKRTSTAFSAVQALPVLEELVFGRTDSSNIILICRENLKKDIKFY